MALTPESSAVLVDIAVNYHKNKVWLNSNLTPNPRKDNIFDTLVGLIDEKYHSDVDLVPSGTHVDIIYVNSETLSLIRKTSQLLISEALENIVHAVLYGHKEIAVPQCDRHKLHLVMRSAFDDAKKHLGRADLQLHRKIADGNPHYYVGGTDKPRANYLTWEE